MTPFIVRKKINELWVSEILEMRQDNALHMMRKEINSYGKLSSNIGCFSTILCIKGILVNVAFNFSGAGHDIEFKEG